LKKILTIVGPTASGKTDIAYHTALILKNKLNKKVEIISADSRQVYKHIPISSSYPPKEYFKNIKHHFIDELEPEEEFNAGKFGTDARKLIRDLLKNNKIPIIVGGSGLYIRSLIYGLFDLEESQENDANYKRKQIEIRSNLEKRYKENGIEPLLLELKKIDEKSAEKMTNVNQRRIIRALEVYYLTGIPLSEHQKKK